METFTGKAIMTINVNGDVSKIKYETSQTVDILNITADEISVSTVNDFDNGTCFVIPANASYEGFRIGTASGAELYIKSNVPGRVSVICARC